MSESRLVHLIDVLKFFVIFLPYSTFTVSGILGDSSFILFYLFIKVHLFILLLGVNVTPFDSLNNSRLRLWDFN